MATTIDQVDAATGSPPPSTTRSDLEAAKTATFKLYSLTCEGGGAYRGGDCVGGAAKLRVAARIARTQAEQLEALAAQIEGGRPGEAGRA